jgi:FkbM family methyltransferase
MVNLASINSCGKAFLSRFLPKKFKQYLKRALGMPEVRLHSDWAILEQIGPVSEEHIVIDLGARNGWFFSCWKGWCPGAIIHAFEPDEAACNTLKERYLQDRDVTINLEGVGDEAKEETFYYMSGSTVSSSFLQHNEKIWKDLKFGTGEIQTRELAVTTLDHYARLNRLESIFLIKIDIQGYELKALKGAVNLLTKTDYVFVESGIQPLYKDAASFTQVHDFLANNNFHLINLRAWHRGNHVLMETDMLFRRNSLAPDIDKDAERIYI